MTDTGTPRPGFPAGFTWGAATAAFQVEGATAEDGRGPSIWDTFTRVPGAVHGGDTADFACDHYHRYPDDIALLADAGLGAYRFSLSWSRIQPEGRGPACRAGLDHYRRVVETCLEHGVTPWVTLYHWDLPQALEDDGGWLNRDTAARFADYTVEVERALGDVVSHWVTVNEPKVAAHAGYGAGIHAPGLRSGEGANVAAHHLLLAHGLAAAALRSGVGDAPTVGVTLDLTVAVPVSDSAADVAAARRVDGNFNRWFLDPVLHGRYPEDMVAWFGGTPYVREGDLDLIAAPLDFLGFNYYRRQHVRAGDGTVGPGQGSPLELDAEVVLPPGVPVTSVGWPVEPGGLHELLVRLHTDHPGTPLVVTENGAAYPDQVGPDGSVDDPLRVAYLDGHLRAVQQALDEGVDVRGWFAWTLLDNFEWAEGYAARFGLVHVDFETQRRTPKTSFGWLSQVARSNTLPAAALSGEDVAR